MREIILNDTTDYEEFIYTRTAQYYETDQMQIVHHSNYLRWFEEARLAFLNHIGLRYRDLEERKIIIPVLSASCTYKKAIRYDDTIDICLKLMSFNGIKFTVHYRVLNHETGELMAEGDTGHGFVNEHMMPFRLKKDAPDVYDAFKNSMGDKIHG